MRPIVPILLVLSSIASLAIERESRPPFNLEKDILIAQFDGKPDADDIHALAALGCMLLHPDFEGMRAYGVTHAYGKQKADVIWYPRKLMDRVFGPENWTEAFREDHDRRWKASVDRVAANVTPVLRAGGHVWVQEAGQSDITRDWIEALVKAGVAKEEIRKRVHVVQHSEWNEKSTSEDDLAFVKQHTDYIKIDDGNRKNLTPKYVSPDAKLLTRVMDGGNPNRSAAELWTMADALVGSWSEKYSVIDEGGVDFSDCVENWWIFGVGDSADSVEEFWNRYLTNQNSRQLPLLSETVHLGDNRVVVIDISSQPANSFWESRSDLGSLGKTSYEAKVDSPRWGGLGLLEYPFRVSKAGIYQLQLRSRIVVGENRTEHNDVFVRLVDDKGYLVEPVANENVRTGDWFKVYNNTVKQWTWETSNKDHDPKSLAWDLKPGSIHRVQISSRSRGIALDRILLWDRAGSVDFADERTGKIRGGKAAGIKSTDALPVSRSVTIKHP